MAAGDTTACSAPTIEIAAATLPKFSPGKAFKDRVTEANKPKETPSGKTKTKSKKA